MSLETDVPSGWVPEATTVGEMEAPEVFDLEIEVDAELQDVGDASTVIEVPEVLSAACIEVPFIGNGTREYAAVL